MKTVETRCQSCGAKVKVLANTPYNGILCSSCSTPKTFRTKTTSNKEKD